MDTLTGSLGTVYRVVSLDSEVEFTPAPLSITPNDQTKVYGDSFTFGLLDITIAGLVGGDTITSVDLTSPATALTADVPTGIESGPYLIVADNAVGTRLTNYDITFNFGSFDVTPAPLTITANDQTKVYATSFAFDGGDITPVGLRNGDTITSIDLVSDATPVTATVTDGPYAIVASNAATSTQLANYAITFVDGVFAVTPAALELRIADQTKVYGTEFVFSDTDFTSIGLRNGDTASAVLVSEGAAATANVDTSPYAITAIDVAGSALGNYELTVTDGSFAVTPAPLQVTADSLSKTYGEEIVFDVSNITALGLQNGELIGSVDLFSDGAAGTAQVADGPFVITASNVEGIVASNYDITFVDGELAVDQAALTITALNVSKVYGYDATSEGSEFEAVGLQNGEVVARVDLVSDGTAGTAQVTDGPFVITASNAQGIVASNYDIDFVDGELTLEQAPLTITATDQRKLIDTELVFDSDDFVVVGIVNGDVVLPTLLSEGADIDAPIAGNPYLIDIIFEDANYNITPNSGTLVVFDEQVSPPVVNPIQPFGTGSLPNPPDSLELVIDGLDQLGDNRGIQQSGTIALTRATETLQNVDEAANAFEAKVNNCDSSVRGFGSYVNCLADSLDSFSDALDGLEKDLPRGLENVSAIIDNARNGVRAAGSRATRRLATATTDAQRRAIQADAVAEARGAIANAKAEIRKSITLIRAEDPDLVQVQTQTVSRIVKAFDTVETKLVRAVQL